MQSTGFMRVNFTLPKVIYLAFKSLVPERRRSRVVSSLLAAEVKKMEKALCKAAKAVEKDKALNEEMQAWDTTLTDGLEDSPWK